MGDLHYPTIKESYEPIEKEREDFFAGFLDAFFNLEADLYVSLGDLTNFGLVDELEDIYTIINKYNKPFFHVIGNHDAYGLTKSAMLEITKQERYHTIQYENLSLIFLDTAKEQDFFDWGGTLDDIQLQWLQEQINLSEDHSVIVFAHHPVYQTTTNSEKEYLSVDPKIPLKDILNSKNGANIYMNGHNHFNSIVEQGNWTYIQVAAVLDEIGARIIDITENHIQIMEVSLSSNSLRTAAKKLGTVINHFNLAPTQLGEEKDRNITITRMNKNKSVIK